MMTKVSVQSICLLLLFVILGCSSSGSSLQITASASTPQNTSAVVAALFQSINSNQAVTTLKIKYTSGGSCASDDPACTCYSIENGQNPNYVSVSSHSTAGTYGSTDDPFTVVDSDFCQDASGNDNTGMASDSKGRFGMFVLQGNVEAVCTSSDGSIETFTLKRGSSGVFRNTEESGSTPAYYPQIYGSFTIDLEGDDYEYDCSMSLSEDGSVLGSSCSDSDGQTVDQSIDTTCVFSDASDNVYKGVWAPLIAQSSSQSMDDTDTLTNDGVNIVSVIAPLLINSSGDISEVLDSSDVSDKIQELQDAGFDVALSVALAYSASGDISSANFATIFQEDTSVDVTTLLQSIESYIQTYAEMARDEEVAVFIPLNEADLALADPDGSGGYTFDTASQWGQDILSVVPTDFTGKLLWKTGMPYSDQEIDLDLTDYDIVGISLTPMDDEMSDLDTDYRETVQKSLSNLVDVQDIYSSMTIIVSEFGLWGVSSYTDEQHALAYQIVLEEGDGLVSGFFAFDGPSIASDPSLKDTDAEDVVAGYYRGNQL